MKGAQGKARAEVTGASGVAAGARRRAILILGMHRSGTSAVARVLGLCGGTLPRESLPPDEHNETGYWEPAAVVRLNDELLSASGSWFDDVGAPSSSWHRSELASAYRRRLGEALEVTYGEGPLWVIKDPRLCRLVPLWREVLEDLGVESLAVIPTRNPLEVAASLGQRDSFSRSKCLLLWLRHFLEAEVTTRNIPRSFVLYESLLRDWRDVVARIGHELSIEWPRPPGSAAPEIERFLDSSLRHHVCSTRDIARSDVSPWFSRVYEWAVEAADGGAASTSVLDEIREALAAADQVFSPLLEDWKQDRLRLTERVSQVPQLMAEIGELRERVSQVPQLMAEIGELHERLERELTAHRARVDALESTHAQLEAELASREARYQADLESMQTHHRAELDHMRTVAHRDAERMRRRWLEARRELHSIHTRVSWALSRPFRWAEGLGAGFAHDLAGALRCCRLRRLENPLRLWRDLRVLRASGLVDEIWYLEQNPDVADSAMDPVTHYVCHGATEARDPNPCFSTRWYLQRHPDVAASGMNPLLHYALHGAAEGRDPSPAFDTAWYRAANEDVIRKDLNPLAHYLHFGRQENRLPTTAREAPPVYLRVARPTGGRLPRDES